MSKTTRLIELMLMLNNKQKYTVRELAEAFNVSYRTMLRDLQSLSELGVPLYSELGVNGGYRSLSSRKLPPIIFTEEEAVAMYFIFQSLEYYGSIPFHEDTKSALSKFYLYLPEETRSQIDKMRDRLVFWNPFREQSSVYLQALLEASISKRKVVINYESNSGNNERTILPIGLYTYNGYWYCPAFCYTKGNFRVFRGDRILNVEYTSDVQPIDSFDEISVLDWLRPLDNECRHPICLILKLDQEGVRRCKSDLTLSHLLQVNKDGLGTIQTTILESKLEYLCDVLYTYGEHVLIEHPSELIDMMKEKIMRHLRLYEK